MGDTLPTWATLTKIALTRYRQSVEHSLLWDMNICRQLRVVFRDECCKKHKWNNK